MRFWIWISKGFETRQMIWKFSKSIESCAFLRRISYEYQGWKMRWVILDFHKRCSTFNAHNFGWEAYFVVKFCYFGLREVIHHYKQIYVPYERQISLATLKNRIFFWKTTNFSTFLQASTISRKIFNFEKIMLSRKEPERELCYL